MGDQRAGIPGPRTREERPFHDIFEDSRLGGAQRQETPRLRTIRTRPDVRKVFQKNGGKISLQFHYLSAPAGRVGWPGTCPAVLSESVLRRPCCALEPGARCLLNFSDVVLRQHQSD